MLPSLAVLGSVAALTAPLFLLVLVGYALARWGSWPKTCRGTWAYGSAGIGTVVKCATSRCRRARLTKLKA